MDTCIHTHTLYIHYIYIYIHDIYIHIYVCMYMYIYAPRLRMYGHENRMHTHLWLIRAREVCMHHNASWSIWQKKWTSSCMRGACAPTCKINGNFQLFSMAGLYHFATAMPSEPLLLILQVAIVLHGQYGEYMCMMHMRGVYASWRFLIVHCSTWQRMHA